MQDEALVHLMTLLDGNVFNVHFQTDQVAAATVSQSHAQQVPFLSPVCAAGSSAPVQHLCDPAKQLSVAVHTAAGSSSMVNLERASRSQPHAGEGSGVSEAKVAESSSEKHVMVSVGGATTHLLYELLRLWVRLHVWCEQQQETAGRGQDSGGWVGSLVQLHSTLGMQLTQAVPGWHVPEGREPISSLQISLGICAWHVH